jgi:ABC-type amino acid transport substrate-binding protein
MPDLGVWVIRVATFLVPPSVMEQNGSLAGFSVDLWNAIAEQLKLKTSYQIEPDVGALEEAPRSKRADITLNVFITSVTLDLIGVSNGVVTYQQTQVKGPYPT